MSAHLSEHPGRFLGSGDADADALVGTVNVPVVPRLLFLENESVSLEG